MPASVAPDADQALQLYLLGGFRVVVGERETPESAWGLRRAHRLVKLLALSPRYRLHRERVVDLLWPGQELENPDNSLHQALYAARRALGVTRASAAPYLQLQGEMVTLAPEAAVWVDVEAFEVAASSARRGRDPAAYRAALALYTGPLLPEDQYEEWVSGRAEALKREYQRLLTELAAVYEASGAYEEAIAPLLRAVELDPTGEDAHVALMRLYALAGQRTVALRRYEALRRTLRDELGVEPQPATVRLYDDIASGRFPPPDAHASGPHRAREPACATNLPPRMNRFIGRARELDEIGRLLDGARIVTIAGPGGSGKTRLALEVAETLAERYPGGVWLVELAGVERASAIPQALAAALGLIEQPGRPLMETITAALAARHALLLLDNCEHLIAACAELAETLERACPNLRMLCTSREPLHIPGEVVWRLSSLSLPGPEPATSLGDALASESVQLFVDRARALAPGFALDERNAPAIIRICRRLDGLPLAIELAAARVGALAVERIAERLEDGLGALGRGGRTGPTRQQTLTAALDWSYGLLFERERHLFRRLAVFPSGFDLEAAEWINAGASDERAADDDTLDTLASLVDKSLVMADESAGAARYRLLEPLRQYAEARLKERGELAAACARRRDWGLWLAERADSELWGEGHAAAVARLEAEYAALRATLEWLLSQEGETLTGARLIAALWQFWLLRGMFTEGRYWLERLLTRESEPSAARAEALMGLFGLTIRQGDYASGAAREAAERSVTIYRTLGDGEGTGRALRMLGVQAYMTGDFARAGEAFEESLARARAAGDAAGVGLALHELGALAWARGAYAEASERMEGALAHLRAAESHPRAAVALLNLGLAPYDAEPDAPLVNEETWVLLRALSGAALIGYTLAHLGALARAQGDVSHARARLEESVAWLRRWGDQAGLAQALGQMGALARVESDYPRAHALLDECLALRRQLGDRRGVGMAGANLGLLALAEGDYARAAALFAEVMAQFVEMGDGSGIEMTLDHQAHLALREGDARRAYALYGECLAGHRAMGRGPLDAARALTGLGASAIALGDSAAARAHLQEAIALYERIGDERRVASLRGRLSEIASQ